MNIEQIKSNVLMKLENKNLNFTKDEIALLQLDNILFLKLLKIFIENRNLLYEYAKLLVTLIDNLTIDDWNFENLGMLEELFGLIGNTGDYEIAESIANDEWYPQSMENDKYYTTCIEKFNEQSIIRGRGGSLDDWSNLINRLLDDKKYFIINKLISSGYYTLKLQNDNDLKRFLSEFPFNQYHINIKAIGKTGGRNAGLSQMQVDFVRDNLDIISNLDFLNLYRMFSNPKFREIISDVIFKKITNENEDLNFIFYGQMNLDFIFDKYKPTITEKNISIFLNADIELTEEEIEQIYILLKKIDFNVSLRNCYLVNNKKIIDLLIEKGNFMFLPWYCRQKDENIEFFSECLVNAIRNNDTKFLSNIKININKYGYEKVLLELINNNYFDLIDFGTTDLDGIYDNKIAELLMKKLIELPSNVKENMDLYRKCLRNSHDYTSSALFEKLLETRQLDKLLVSSFPDNIIIENYNVLKEIIQNNFSFANEFLNKYASLIVSNDKYKNLYLSLDVEYFYNIILKKIEHIDYNEHLYDKNLYDAIKSMFIKKYNLNENHLERLTQEYGFVIIKYINNPNIINIINLDDEKFEMFIELFPISSYEMKDLEIIYDSFKQSEFAETKKEIIQIFPSLMHYLQDKNEEFYTSLEKLKDCWNDVLKKKIIAQYPDEENIINANGDYIDYIGKILLETNSGIEKDKYTDILHIITNYYISIEREQYRTTYDIYNDAKVPFEYDKKSIEQLKMLKLLEEAVFKKIINGVETPIYSKIKNELANNGISFEDIYNVMLLIVKKRMVSHLENNDYIEKIEKQFELIKNEKDLKKYTGLVFKCAKAHIDSIELSDNDLKEAKKKYYLDDSQLNIFELFSNIRIELLEKNVLSDPEKYKSLQKIIKKYKLHLLPPQVDTIIEKKVFDLSCTTRDISTFISFFHSIYEEPEFKPEDANITVLFNYIDKYSAVSNIYSQILTVEDAGLIRMDPGPYRSEFPKEVKLGKAVEKTLSNFRRNSVKVPAFYFDATLDDGKQLRAIVGNFTKPSNLTHGERTNACMRIGGAGYTLFDSDEIFHIEFDDPQTGEYISRVTGFRNGNTVFLNELRNSCNLEKYSDLDVINACKQVANQLIELSKDSTCPIENVVVHRDYAMKAVIDDRVDLQVKDNKAGLKHFYSDVGSYVHVLASTTKGGFTPVNLDNSNVPNYQPVREKIRSGKSKDIIEQINRIYTINLALKGEDYYVEPLVTDNVTYGIVGEDWFVFIDSSNKIVSQRMDRDDRSKAEFEIALEEIKNYLDSSMTREEIYAK